MNRHFTKVNMYLVNKYMKTYSIALVISEVQTKIIMTYYYIPLRMTKINFFLNLTLPSSGKDEEQLELLYISGGVEK